MSDLALMAATAWAHSHAARSFDPVEFGNQVALVHLACQQTQYHAGDEKAIAAALASLSIPSEVWQSLAQLSSHLLRSKEPKRPLPVGGAE